MAWHGGFDAVNGTRTQFCSRNSGLILADSCYHKDFEGEVRDVLQVDVEPIVKADPLFSECRHAPLAYSRRGSEPLPEVIIPVRNKANIHYDDGE